MGIPACLAFHLITALCSETADCILDRTRHNVMNAGDAVCRRRTFVKNKLTFSVQFTDASVESIILIPYCENLFLYLTIAGRISNGLREFWEGRALRNCPVGNFSEGDSLQG